LRLGKFASHALRGFRRISSTPAVMKAAKPMGLPLHSRYDKGIAAEGYPAPHEIVSNIECGDPTSSSNENVELRVCRTNCDVDVIIFQRFIDTLVLADISNVGKEFIVLFIRNFGIRSDGQLILV
jgi:hypothetical protein